MLSISSIKQLGEGYTYLYKSPLNKEAWHTANDFDLSIQDMRYINIVNNKAEDGFDQIYKEQFLDLKHFVFHRSSLYVNNIISFSCYITFYILVKLCKEQEMSMKEAEKIFTDQMILNILKGDLTYIDKHQKDIFKYWVNCKEVLQNFVKVSKTYSKVSTSTLVHFRTSGKSFKVHIPLVGYLSKHEIDITYFGQHRGQRPAWYTTPILFKIYDYFLEKGITIRRFNYYSFDLEKDNKPHLITIPNTDNVSKLVERYRKIQPYPYANIFKKDKQYYTNKPLNMLLNE